MKRSSLRLRAFTLVELLVVIAIIGVLVALLLPAIQAARESARRSQCINTLHNLSLAALNYESSRRTLPPADVRKLLGTQPKSYSSWVTETLPYIEQTGLVSATDWTGKTLEERDNMGDTTHHMKIEFLLCPSDNPDIAIVNDFYGARANYVANAGLGEYWAEDLTPAEAVDNDHLQVLGPFRVNIGMSLRQATDGTSNTVAISELRFVEGEDTRGAMHFGPASLYMHDFPPNAPERNPADPSQRWDDRTRHCERAVAREIAPCRPVSDNSWKGLWHHSARSVHSGGVNVAMLDGSTHFITDDVELLVWQAVGTPDGGEVISTAELF
ncbi:MAG: DUF1559 domain-containing protein [Planctomycetales bacterium]|nr:DUF1559 domain-containing protein [Planctomycetales bacterium]